MSDAHVSDEQILAQQDSIKKEIAANQPLVGDIQDVSSLLDDYKENERFQDKIRVCIFHLNFILFREILSLYSICFSSFVSCFCRMIKLTRLSHIFYTQQLQEKYSKFRRVRGDGNCFYRSYLVGCLEWLATNTDEAAKAKFVDTVTKSKDVLIGLGKPEFTIEMFWEMLMDEINVRFLYSCSVLAHSSLSFDSPSHTHLLLPLLPLPSPLRCCLYSRFTQAIIKDNNGVEDIIKAFNDKEVASYCVAFVRQVTSAHLTEHSDTYIHYLDNPQPMSQFVSAEVEPMDKESDFVQCVALSKEFGVPVVIQYVDQSEGPLNSHILPSDDCTPAVHLLYRPGHYDILYK